MKTPDEIKKGLEVCNIWMDDEPNHCLECPYFCTKDCADTLMNHALALIQQLQSDNAEKDQRIQQLEAERDAALEDKRGECTYCAYLPGETIPQTCFDCANKGFYRWEWRGVQKEGSDDGKE